MKYRKQIECEILKINHAVITGYFKRFIFERLLSICISLGLLEVFPIRPLVFLNYPDSPAKIRVVYEKL